jgi:hypothetical protein
MLIYLIATEHAKIKLRWAMRYKDWDAEMWERVVPWAVKTVLLYD